ncbi:MAG: histidine phosphatase family protein [Bacteroidota bacterium]
MSVLLLARHGQTLLFSEDHDQLSPAGVEQARAMGAYWATLGLGFDRVLVGPKRAHRQTYEAARAAFKAASNQPLPEANMLPGFNDHQGEQVFRAVVPTLDNGKEMMERFGRAFLRGDLPMRRTWMEAYVRVSRRWMNGELPADRFESWTAFRARVGRTLDTLKTSTGPRDRILVFTSAGPVAAALGHAFNLDDETVLKLSWTTRNASLTEFFLSQDELSLSSFNATPYLNDQKLLTYV